MTGSTFGDIIGLRHEEGSYDPRSGALDCAGVVIVVLTRLGIDGAPESFREAMSPSDGEVSGWTAVGDGAAIIPGDVIVTDAGGGALHVAVAVSPYRAISSARRLGVYAHPIDRGHKRMLGIYRPPHEPAP